MSFPENTCLQICKTLCSRYTFDEKYIKNLGMESMKNLIETVFCLIQKCLGSADDSREVNHPAATGRQVEKSPA